MHIKMVRTHDTEAPVVRMKSNIDLNDPNKLELLIHLDLFIAFDADDQNISLQGRFNMT